MILLTLVVKSGLRFRRLATLSSLEGIEMDYGSCIRDCVRDVLTNSSDVFSWSFQHSRRVLEGSSSRILGFCGVLGSIARDILGLPSVVFGIDHPPPLW